MQPKLCDSVLDGALGGAPDGVSDTAPDTASDSAHNITSDALSVEFFEARQRELRKRVGQKRYRHVMGVVETAELLARTYGVDVSKARLAGLLHDWDKAYDDLQIRARVEQLGLKIDPWVLQYQPRVLHGITAACALAREFPNIPDDVLRAVEYHTTADTHMSPLDMVIYVADALEPNRNFGRVDELRARIGNASLEELFVAVLGYWTTLIIERGRSLYPRTVDVWNAYVAKNEKPFIREDVSS